MKFAYDIIKKPVITERSMMGAQDNKYTFEVAVDAGKRQALGRAASSRNWWNGRTLAAGVKSNADRNGEEAKVHITDGRQQTEHVRQRVPVSLFSKVRERVRNLRYGPESVVLAVHLRG